MNNTHATPIHKTIDLAFIEQAACLVGQHFAASKKSGMDVFLEQKQKDNPVSLFVEVWERAGLAGTPARLKVTTQSDLPFVVYQLKTGWGILHKRDSDGHWVGKYADESPLMYKALEGLCCISLPSRVSFAKRPSSTVRLVRDALWERKNVFFDAILATALTSLLALAVSLYAMQIYDRVIPTQGLSTLWVLTVGAIMSIGLEMILKQVRSYSIDRTCNVIDRYLSEWFFERMIGVRMEVRPASVGTIASQMKGFEMVRGVLASTSLFVLADVPFALFFLAVIGMIGGWVVVVPAIALPIALITGLMFQSAIQRHTRNNLAASNLKTGLLVETVDGAEVLKANNAEWNIQSRWSHLTTETTREEQKIRNYSSLAQNLTGGLQQFSYVAMIAVGAYLATQNELTMGALLACSIIGNRAMAPIVQLPGVMVQWALARAAIEGLDAIIDLPNELDGRNKMISLQELTSGFQFQNVRFTYDKSKQVAFEVNNMSIGLGETVGLLGAIGSGKSTLLKLASGLYNPNEGDVHLSDINMTLLIPSMVRESVAYLPQDMRLFSGTLRENLLLGLPDPGDDAILDAAKRTGLMDLIGGQPRGLALEITEGGRGVSGGQKQLIAITRMLIARPKVWLLDEPTGSMDSASEARIVNLLREVAAEGATLIVSTHKTAILPVLDRLIVLQKGRVLMDGSRDIVLSKLMKQGEKKKIEVDSDG